MGGGGFKLARGLVAGDCQVRLCGSARKKSLESARIGATKIGLVQIVIGEGFGKNGEDFEVVGLRAGLPTSNSSGNSHCHGFSSTNRSEWAQCFALDRAGHAEGNLEQQFGPALVDGQITQLIEEEKTGTDVTSERVD